jgi:PiT family inorganic phosphate transporter
MAGKEMIEFLTAITIGAGFIYAFVNGYHDGGNVIATIIASRSVKVRTAFLIGCIAEFSGAILLGTAVARTIGTNLIKENVLINTDPISGSIFVLCAILGSILWNLITAKLGLPSSSSHALMGGLIGAGVASFGFAAVNWMTFLLKVILVMFSSPILGLIIGYFIMHVLMRNLAYYTKGIEKYLKKAQYISMAGLAFSHGSGDAQKAMGMIAIELMILDYYTVFTIPWWTIAGCAAMIALGMSVGGWKIMNTVGKKLYTIEPMHSLASQIAASTIILSATLTGLPVSTTQIITSSVMGVGAADNKRKVKWGVADGIIASWFITIPAAALVSAMLATILHLMLKMVL